LGLNALTSALLEVHIGLIGLVQLTQGILHQTLDNSQNQDGSARNKLVAPETTTNQINADTFVPSAQNPAQDAGIFNVQQVSLFSAAANFLLQPPPAAPAAATTALAAPPAKTQNGNATATPANNTPAPAAAQAAAPAPSAATSAPTDAAAIQQQLVSLNASLAVLGLSASEINVVDGVAQLIKDFNPAAFGGLIDQLQALAQASAPQTAPAAAPAAAPANASGSTPAAANTGAATTAAPATANPNFTLRSLNIQFSGANETLQGTGHGKNAHDTIRNVSAFQLNISEVTLTLNNNNTWQTTLIQAPQPQPQAAPLKAAAATA
jgi:hypothetical protein